MKNLFKYILHYWQAVIAIVAILIVQAYCDLSLPAYTSDIVNSRNTYRAELKTRHQQQFQKKNGIS